MKPLRVAVLARAVMPLHGLGGLERSVHDLVTHLAARDVDVTLIVPPPATRGSSPSPFDAARVRILHVPYRTFPLANRRGTTVLDRSTAYLLYGWRAGRLAASLARRGDVDIIHGFGASLLGATTEPAAAPLVLNPQGLEEFGATAASQPLSKRIGYAPLRAAVRRCARAADRIIATDVSLETTVARHLLPRPEQMITIPNGIDLSTIIPADGDSIRRAHGIAPDALVWLSAGRLEFNKGFDVLADALARAEAAGSFGQRAWRWIVVGDGPYRTTIASAARAAGIADRVRFAGRVTEQELHAWYEAATVFVHPTRYEGSSLVTLEAMAHRRPVIATRAGGLPDKVHADVNGWLVDAGDAQGLANALREAASDRNRLATFGDASRHIVERHFAWPVIADRHMAMYEEIRARRVGLDAG